MITLDAGYGNTGACESAITFIDGEKGILRYRGYSIEQLAEYAQFSEVAYLLIHGDLPNREQFADFRDRLTYHSLIHEDMKKFYEGFPAGGSPDGHSLVHDRVPFHVLSGQHGQQRRPEHHPRAGQSQNDRRLRVQEIGGTTLYLSPQ